MFGFNKEKKKHEYSHYEPLPEKKKEGIVERITKAAVKWRQPEVTLTEEQQKQLQAEKQKAYFEMRKKQVQAKYKFNPKQPQKRLPGSSIFDAMATSAKEQFGGQQKESYLGGLINSEFSESKHSKPSGGFGLSALEAEGIIKPVKPKAIEPQKRKYKIIKVEV